MAEIKPLDPFEMRDHEELKRITSLASKIFAVIEETGYGYGDVMCALKSIESHYEKKGCDLMNSVSIQKVAEFGGLLS